jgi:hypothetical protein
LGKHLLYIYFCFIMLFFAYISFDLNFDMLFGAQNTTGKTATMCPTPQYVYFHPIISFVLSLCCVTNINIIFITIKQYYHFEEFFFVFCFFVFLFFCFFVFLFFCFFVFLFFCFFVFLFFCFSFVVKK